MSTDAADLALRMHELALWLEGEEALAAERHLFDSAPFGRSLVCIDPTSVAPGASLNRNRIYLHGNATGLTRQGLTALVGKFKSRGVRRFFAWLSPGPGADEVREWLRSLSFTQVQWTRYPTLLLSATPQPLRETGFRIHTADAAEVAAARAWLGDNLMDSYVSTVGKPGFTHYLVYDGSRPIAAAALVKFADLGYLTYAETAASHRRRGAQSALIAHRVAAARAMGCKHIVSQTLTLLADSLANLQRCGFREVYELEAYEYARDP